jgi:hypothetical protein
MVGGKAEERRRLIEAARELRGPRGVPEARSRRRSIRCAADTPQFSFGGGADDDFDFRSTGKGVAKHAEWRVRRAPKNKYTTTRLAAVSHRCSPRPRTRARRSRAC